MALTADEQKLADAANAALPEWFSASGRVQEEVGMMAKQMGLVLAKGRHQIAQTYIGTAAGPSGDEPDWLDMLAQDRGTHRQWGEPTSVLRARLQRTPRAVVRSELLADVQAMVDASAPGLTTKVAMVEYPRDSAFLGTWVQDGAATGGVFSKAGNVMTFTPAKPFIWTPFVQGISGPVAKVAIQIFNSASGTNDGSFLVTGLTSGGGVTYTNAAGANETSTTSGWATFRVGADNVRMDLKTMAYFDRGFRMWRGQSVPGEKVAMGGMAFILPYGCPESLRLSVAEALRQKKAAGFAVIIEQRANP